MVVMVVVVAECVDKVRAGGAEYWHSDIYLGDEIKHNKEGWRKNRRRETRIMGEEYNRMLLLLLLLAMWRCKLEGENTEPLRNFSAVVEYYDSLIYANKHKPCAEPCYIMIHYESQPDNKG